MKASVPKQVLSYQLVRKLGEGGMGAVYEAFHPQLSRRAAIKLLHRQYTADPEQVTRFFNEARASNLVRHPSLVDIYECGETPEGSAFIIMEFLEGETLRGRMEKWGPLGSACIPVFRQLSNALAATHAKGIVHRDLKPENVMIVSDAEVSGGERVKVLDFGIAKLLTEAQAGGQHIKTRTGTVMGTPRYMSPEQCRGNVDVRQPADVYSLGAMLFEQYAGVPPFVSDGLGELYAMHLFMPAPKLSSVAKGIPAPLDRLVEDMLAKDPGARPTMTQVAERLGSLPAHAEAGVRGAEFPAQSHLSATTVRQSRGQLVAVTSRKGSFLRVGAAGLVLLLVGIGVAWSLRKPGLPKRQAAASQSAPSSVNIPVREPSSGEPSKATPAGLGVEPVSGSASPSQLQVQNPTLVRRDSAGAGSAATEERPKGADTRTVGSKKSPRVKKSPSPTPAMVVPSDAKPIPKSTPTERLD